MRTHFLFLASVLFLVACGPSMHTPAGFARVDGTHDLRITSPDGVVIAVNVHRNRRPHGDLEFWAGALQARIERTYTDVERLEIENDGGERGIQLRAVETRDGRPFRYWAAVFLVGRKVVLVEAGGDEAYFSEHEDDVEAAMRSVQL